MKEDIIKVSDTSTKYKILYDYLIRDWYKKENYMKKYDYLVVGAGLFASVFAYEMKKRGKKILVIDKKDHIGGNCYTKTKDSINIHSYGAHIFHTSDIKIWQYINKFAKFNSFINSPIANYKGTLYNLPFNMNTFAKMWDISTPKQARDIIDAQIKKEGIKTPENLEQQAISMVGRDIYEKLVKGYTSKQWGKPCNQLPTFIIKRLPVRFTFDNNYFNDIYQGIPIGGYTPIFEKLLDGIEVKLSTDYFEDRDYFENVAHKIIYTGQIDRYYRYTLGKLEYRSLRFENQYLDTPNYQGNAVINYTDEITPYTRIIEHKFFEHKDPYAIPHTIITREYPDSWDKDKEPYYPINDEKNNTLYQKYLNHSSKDSHIIFGGRLGTYKYMDMHITIASALELVKNQCQEI